MGEPFVTLQSEVQNYRVHVDSHVPQVVADHREAMACMDLEDAIFMGLKAFQVIEHFDRKWHHLVRTGKIEHSTEDELAFKSAFESWLEPCAFVLAAIDACAADGFDVERSQEFRELVAEVRLCMADDG